MKYVYGAYPFKIHVKHGRGKRPAEFLEDSIIKERANEISEIANKLGGEAFNKYAARAEKYLLAIENLIPEDKKKLYSRFEDGYLGAECKASIITERVTYTQGLIDGVELARILLPVLLK